MLSPEEIVNKTIKIGVNKSNASIRYLIFKAILAGIFVVLGVCARNAAVYSIDNDSLARILGGLFFPIGFIFIVFLGGELFTGNTLMIMAVLDKKVKLRKMVRNHIIVYIGNFIGSLIGVYLVYLSGFFSVGKGRMGAYIIQTLYNKLMLDNTKLLFSSIICNIFVCGVILMITATKDVVAKILLSWFTICTFGIVGFEHIVVNMYYIPSGFLAIKSKYTQVAAEVYNITENKLASINGLNVFRSFSMVTLGNLIGGIVFVGMLIFYIRRLSFLEKYNT